MNWHDATRLHAGPRATNFDQAPIFVVGMLRSGTTLVEQIIAPRPAVHGAGERPELARTFARIGFYELHAYEHDLANLGWITAQQRRLMEHWHKALPNPLLTVKLIDVVDDFAGTLRRVLDFLDFPYDPACETFHEVDRGVRTVSRHRARQPINAHGVGRWREYERPLAPPISALHEYDALNNELYNP